MKKTFVLLIGLFMVFVGVCQKLNPVRLEVPGSLNADTYKVETLGKKGVMVFYESSNVENNKRIWYYALLDTKLKQVWLKKIPVIDKMVFVDVRQTGNKVYFLYKNFGKTGGDYDVYEIVVFDKIDDHFKSISGSIPLGSEIAGFQVINDKACLGLNMKGFEADLAFVDLNTGEIKPFHLDKEDGALVEYLYADTRNKRFYVVVKYFNDVTFFKDNIVSFNISGKENSSLFSEYPNNMKLPRNFRFVSITNNKIELVGTYDYISGKKPDWRDVVNVKSSDGDPKTAGFFYMRFVDGKQDTLRFYDFMKFGNIHYSNQSAQFRYANDKSSDKHGKTKKVNLFFDVNNPLITPLGDEIVFSVELYKPYYITETRMDYDFYGRMYPYTYEVFAGYEFYDVIFAGFGKSGDMVWNNDFPLSDLMTYSLDNHIVLVPDNQLLTLAYVTKGELISQTFEKGKDLSDREKIKIETVFKKDRIMEDENNKIVKWYDDYYLIYGYQKIKNRSLGEKVNRTVFFINKLAFK
jgi:hypothetical protein